MTVKSCFLASLINSTESDKGCKYAAMICAIVNWIYRS